MKKNCLKVFIFTTMVAISALLISAASASAADQLVNKENKNFGMVFKFENTFLKYSQEGGVSDTVGSSVDFDLSYAPRVEVGFFFYKGLGIRGRYFNFDDSAKSDNNNGLCDVDTYYADVELFQNIQLSKYNELEWSIGLRKLNFKQTLTDNFVPSAVKSEFDGWGGTFALEFKRYIFYGKLYARGRFSILTGDADISNYSGGSLLASFDAEDDTVYLTEIALGYEFNIPIYKSFILKANVGAEWQNWANVAVADTAFGGVGNDDVLEDAGFLGFVAGIGFEF